MSLPKISLFVLSLIAFGAMPLAGSHAQQTDKPFDFKPLIPPIAPLPPNSAVTSGSVGGSQDPYTTAPLQRPTQTPSQSAPGMRFSIPTR